VGRIFIIAIAGGTGSGKSTLAQALSDHLGAPVLHIDDYYHSFNHLSLELRERVNFDHPQSIDHQFLIHHIECLQNGEPIQKPVYDFTQHARAPQTEEFHPANFLLIDGLFALHWTELRALADLRLYVDTPETLRFERRLKRDVEERGRDATEVTHRFTNHVNPMHNQHVEPTREHAHHVLCGSQTLETAIATVLSQVENLLRPTAFLV